MPRIVKSLLTLSKDRNPKTYAAIASLCCNLYSVRMCLRWSSWIRKVSASTYKGKIWTSLPKNADSNIAALRKCRNEESFQLFGREQKLLPKQQKNQRFEFAFKDTKIPRSRPSSLVNTQSGEEQSRDDLQLPTGTSASRHISRPST